MIAVQVLNVREASVSGSGNDHCVTLHFGNNDRVSIHCKSRVQAMTIALAVNGSVDAALAPAAEVAQ